MYGSVRLYRKLLRPGIYPERSEKNWIYVDILKFISKNSPLKDSKWLTVYYPFLLLSIFHQFRRFLFDTWLKRDKIWLDVSTVTRLWPGGSGFRIPTGTKDISFSETSRPVPHPHIYWVAWVITLELKRLGNDFDHSLPSSVEIKKEWSHTSAPPL
jgi:hypothetical protein